jgi:hypothetical protein
LVWINLSRTVPGLDLALVSDETATIRSRSACLPRTDSWVWRELLTPFLDGYPSETNHSHVAALGQSIQNQPVLNLRQNEHC